MLASTNDISNISYQLVPGWDAVSHVLVGVCIVKLLSSCFQFGKVFSGDRCSRNSERTKAAPVQPQMTTVIIGHQFIYSGDTQALACLSRVSSKVWVPVSLSRVFHFLPPPFLLSSSHSRFVWTTKYCLHFVHPVFQEPITGIKSLLT